MKALIWIIIAIIVLGGLFWYASSNNDSSESNSNSALDGSSIETRVLNTDTDVFNEIDETVNALG